MFSYAPSSLEDILLLGLSTPTRKIFLQYLKILTHINDRFQMFPGEIEVKMGPYFCWYGTTSQASRSKSLLIIMIHQGIPIIFGIFATLIGYSLTLRTTKQIPKGVLAYLEFNPYQLLWYPVVFFISFTPSLIHTIYSMGCCKRRF